MGKGLCGPVTKKLLFIYFLLVGQPYAVDIPLTMLRTGPHDSGQGHSTFRLSYQVKSQIRYPWSIGKVSCIKSDPFKKGFPPPPEVTENGQNVRPEIWQKRVTTMLLRRGFDPPPSVLCFLRRHVNFNVKGFTQQIY